MFHVKHQTCTNGYTGRKRGNGMSSNEFKIKGVRFAYMPKVDGMRIVRTFSTHYNAWITIGKARTIQGARELAENFIEWML